MPDYFTYKKDVKGPLGFTKGRGYYSRGQQRPAIVNPQDPYAAMSDQRIQQIINERTKGYGPPQTDQDIQHQAQAQIDPIIAAITKSVTDKTTSSSAGIHANSEQLAKSLADVDYSAPYRDAEDRQAKVDAVLHSALSNGAVANDVGSRLANIGEPGALNPAVAAIATQGTGNANAGLARGSASQSELIAHAAAADAYGKKQPGIAQLSGLQEIANLERSAQTEIGDKTTSVLSRLPDIIQALRSSGDAKQSERAQIATHLFEFLTGQNMDRANARFSRKLAKDKLGLDAVKAGTTANHYANSDSTAAQRAAETARHNAQSEKTAATRAKIAAANSAISANRAAIDGAKYVDGKKPKPSPGLSAKYGYIVDQYGDPILKDGKKIPVAKTGKDKTTKKPWEK